MGDAVHESQAALILQVEELDIGGLAQKHRVDAVELGYLRRRAWQAWQYLASLFSSPICEEELSWIDARSQIVLTGHPDVFSVDGDQLVIADWKSGFLWSDCESQLRGYAWLIAQTCSIKTVSAFHVNIRLGEIERWNWTFEELAEWWAEMAEKIADGGEIYSPSCEVCGHCPRFRECPAGMQLAIKSVHSLIDDQDVPPCDYWSGNAEAAYHRARFVAKLADESLESLRTIIANFGEMTLASGAILALRRESREKIDAQVGWPVMRESLALGEVLGAMTVGKTKLLDAVRATVPRGWGKEAASDFMARLVEAGAVTETFIERLEYRKAPAGAGVKVIEEDV